MATSRTTPRRTSNFARGGTARALQNIARPVPADNPMTGTPLRLWFILFGGWIIGMLNGLAVLAWGWRGLASPLFTALVLGMFPSERLP